MKRIFKVAIFTSETVPGYTIRELENVEFAEYLYGSSGSSAERALVRTIADKFAGWTKINAILGFKLVSHYDGTHHMLIAYGTPAFIEQDPGSKTKVRFVNYEVDI